eukprot:g8190.t1
MSEAQIDETSLDRKSVGEKDEESEKLFKVFLGGIPRMMEEKELFDVFRSYKPTDAIVMRDMSTKRSRGFAFITFPSQKSMDRAIAELHNTRISGRIVTVTEARPFERSKERSRDSPERIRKSRRYDYDDRPSSNRRAIHESYHHRGPSSYHRSSDYSSRRYSGSSRYPQSDRGFHGDYRRESSRYSSNYHETKRPRWRSRERLQETEYNESRRRQYSPGPFRPKRRDEIYNRG